MRRIDHNDRLINLLTWYSGYLKGFSIRIWFDAEQEESLAVAVEALSSFQESLLQMRRPISVSLWISVT
ncbi:hypothetical protein HPP92_017423 [Vanilla planifolia]|uniref:Uncharacterized protein n=1 Tax=Vanilla planifolia TaxID=51239 RepID=A0A835UR09_VANPL|nr:hypothetical protein HPP92_017423 [Vanilla planifolia]